MVSHRLRLVAPRGGLLWLAVAITGCGDGAVNSQFRIGTEQLEHSEAEAAIATFTSILRQDPKHAESYLARGSGYLMEGKYEQALRDLRQAQQLMPVESHILHRNLGIAYYEINDPDAAIAELTIALRIEPDDWVSRSARGLAYHLANRLEDALIDLNAVIQDDPNYSMGYVDRAGVWMEREDYDKALEDLNRALQLQPKNPKAYFMRSAVWFLLGDLNRSMADQNRLLALDPGQRGYPRRDIMRVFPASPRAAKPSAARSDNGSPPRPARRASPSVSS